jgi:cytochrome c553
MLVKFVVVFIAGWLAAVGAAQAAGDAAAGKAKSAVCAGCHGDKGQGMAPFPALANIPQAAQLKALQEFKSGARVNPIMNGNAAGLSEQDMEDLAAYFASFK